MDYDAFADLYDHQYDLYRDDLHFYAGLGERANGPVLEIGAGTGRVTSFLARRGVAITGLEPSERMIERGRERAAKEQLSLAFVQGDARTFRLKQTFALAIAPFNALMHLYTPNEQLQALENIHAHLNSGAPFAFDLYVPRFGKANTMRHEGETFHSPDGARTDVFLVQRHDRVRQHITTEYHVDTTQPGGALTRRHYTLTQRYYTRYEVEWLLRYAGFESPRVTGSFQGGPLERGSDVMVFQTRAL
ncbi:class I SAM-dependent methyltransferase [Deinococcus sp. KSM4-11]|uniref:class I SAM-dependent methyltransferase n=1 Tax=Deinococcus sp. KSM4-11 TaxID=2568654 RepID=UPI0010A3A6E2|nr:class I SAM-dependent methyltransferase [Deinococcus sp. KSM4-11]THF88874.1 class I SAM-dependent methyltransferase [Deinococcus sp. KSM4-11]